MHREEISGVATRFLEADGCHVSGVVMALMLVAALAQRDPDGIVML
jgi:hypothetical protein